jgi:hypothetical protein
MSRKARHDGDDRARCAADDIVLLGPCNNQRRVRWAAITIDLHLFGNDVAFRNLGRARASRGKLHWLSTTTKQVTRSINSALFKPRTNVKMDGAPSIGPDACRTAQGRQEWPRLLQPLRRRLEVSIRTREKFIFPRHLGICPLRC